MKIVIEFTADKIDRDKFMQMLDSVNTKFSHMIKGYADKKFDKKDMNTLDDIIKGGKSETIIPNWFIGIREEDINEHDNSTATWYLLYDGSSPDGMGRGEYIGRTTDKEEAINHFRKVKNNPYSTGKIRIVTDEEVILALDEKDFEKL